MFYPIKFFPVFKDYIWGGRNLEKLGKTLPEGLVAESWEISCHKDGPSVISNGAFKGYVFEEIVKKFGSKMVGSQIPAKYIEKFPLLVKLIDANDNLSVQVHPDDKYAFLQENGEYGKNEMWYVIEAEPGAKLIYDVKPNTTREDFINAVNANNIESCLKHINVSPGDIINIPSGLVHAVGKGIVLAEVQQNSNLTYRVFDYDRVGKDGNKRPLHIEKALDVIDFNACGRKEKFRGLEIELGQGSLKKHLVSNPYFSTELYCIKDKITETADGSRFYIFTFIEGEGELYYRDGKESVKMGETIFIPAQMESYVLEGRFKALKFYMPDINKDLLVPLLQAGYSRDDIADNVGGVTVKYEQAV